MELDLTKYTKDKVKVAPTVVEAIVIDIKQVLARDVFGDKATEPNKVYLEFTFENAEHQINSKQALALYDVSELDNRSQLGKYVNKYDNIAIGQKVTLLQAPNGFYKVLID